MPEQIKNIYKAYFSCHGVPTVYNGSIFVHCDNESELLSVVEARVREVMPQATEIKVKKWVRKI